MTSSRRQFLKVAAGTAAWAAMPGMLFAGTEPLLWHDVRDWGVEGKGWDDTIRYFDRLPAKARGVVREPVWDLSRHSAGMVVRFATDAPDIHVRYTLLYDTLAMPHMPATGVSGLDLYAADNRGIDRWVGVVLPDDTSIERPVAEGLRERMRRYTVYLPLFNGVESLEIGVASGAEFDPVAPREEKPMLFYGTSIMHGACASRPGMAIPAILGRRLNRATVNLGFSGNGRMEPEVGALLAELDPSVFAVDCLPNMYEDLIDERTVPLVRQLRTARPETPILLVEDRSFTQTRFFPRLEQTHRSIRQALRRAFVLLSEAGVDDLYYLEGEQLLGDDGEAATDGSHPNDLGMVRYADAYETALRDILHQY
jgi:hypothetical protein